MASLASSAQGSKEVPPFKPIAAEKRAQLEALRTSDPGELRRRWGPFVDLAGKVWVSTRSAAGGFEVQWVIEGALAQLTEFGCGRSPCFQRTGLLAYVVEPPFGLVDTSFEIDWSDRGAQRGFRSGDALHVSYGGFNGARYKFDAQTGLGFFGGYDYRVATDQDLHALAALGVELESQKAERLRVAAETQRKAAEARAQADADRAAAARAAEEARLLAVQSTEESRRRGAEEAALRRRLEEEQQARALSDAEAKRKAAAEGFSRQRDALAGRFPPIAVGETKTPMLAAGGKLRPAIHYLRNDQRAKLRVEVVSSSFAPLLAVYEVDREAPLASANAATGTPARLSVNVAGDASHYVVVVHSLDGKRGAYALKIERE